MADTKISGLSADASPTSDDLTVLVDDPGGTPANKKSTLGNIITKAHGLSDGIIKVATGAMTVVAAPTGTIVGTSDSQTLTNKTLTAPVLNTGTVGTSLVPTSNDGAPLGDTTHQFSDLFLAEGGVINFDNGDATITQTGNDITIAGITSFGVGTATAVTVGTIEIGAASDTTVSRSSAGVLAVEGVVIPTVSSTSTLTNKRVTKRVTTTTDDSTAVIDIDSCDDYELSAVANATEFTITGTPTDGQTLFIRFKDAGVAKALTWTGFTVLGVTLPTTTVAGKWHAVGAKYFSSASAWMVMGVSVQA